MGDSPGSRWASEAPQMVAHFGSCATEGEPLVLVGSRRSGAAETKPKLRRLNGGAVEWFEDQTGDETSSEINRGKKE